MKAKTMTPQHWLCFFASGAFGWVGALQVLGVVSQITRWDSLFWGAAAIICFLVCIGPLDDYVTEKAIRRPRGLSLRIKRGNACRGLGEDLHGWRQLGRLWCEGVETRRHAGGRKHAVRFDDC
jgi:hypothetical protein